MRVNFNAKLMRKKLPEGYVRPRVEPFEQVFSSILLEGMVRKAKELVIYPEEVESSLAKIVFTTEDGHKIVRFRSHFDELYGSIFQNGECTYLSARDLLMRDHKAEFIPCSELEQISWTKFQDLQQAMYEISVSLPVQERKILVRLHVVPE